MTPQLSLQLRLENEGLTPDAARKTSLAAAAATTEELRVAYVACQLEGDHSDRERRARELLTACGMIEIATAVATPRPDQRAIVTQAPVVGELSAQDFANIGNDLHDVSIAARDHWKQHDYSETFGRYAVAALCARGFKVSR